MNLSAAYGTVNHILLLTKLYGITEDAEFIILIGSMMANQNIHSPVLFNVNTNDQPVHNKNHSFIYADDLCIATQRSTF